MASLGFQFAGDMVLCVLVGNWIDGRYKTGPWGVLVGAATGFAVGFYNIFRVVSRQEPKDKAPGPGTRGRDKQ